MAAYHWMTQKVTCRPEHRDQLWAQQLITSMENFTIFYTTLITQQARDKDIMFTE